MRSAQLKHFNYLLVTTLVSSPTTPPLPYPPLNHNLVSQPCFAHKDRRTFLTVSNLHKLRTSRVRGSLGYILCFLCLRQLHLFQYPHPRHTSTPPFSTASRKPIQTMPPRSSLTNPRSALPRRCFEDFNFLLIRANWPSKYWHYSLSRVPSGDSLPMRLQSTLGCVRARLERERKCVWGG